MPPPNLHGARKSALLAIAALTIAGCGSGDSGGDTKDAHNPKVLRYMERQIGPDLGRQLSKDEGKHVTVTKVQCVDTGDRSARCFATDSTGGKYGVDVHVASDGSFLWEVRP